MPSLAEVQKGKAASTYSQLGAILDQQTESCAETRVRKLLQHILESDPSCTPDTRALAAGLGISASRLRHLFKDAVGVSISRYLKLTRMRRAFEILQTGQATVLEAMFDVDMHDISHFGRDYKALFGETPRQTRIAAIGREQKPVAEEEPAAECCDVSC